MMVQSNQAVLIYQAIDEAKLPGRAHTSGYGRGVKKRDITCWDSPLDLEC